MDKLIFLGFLVACGIICIIAPKAVSELLCALSWAREEQSKTRPIIVRLIGVTIIVLVLVMYFG